MFANSLRGLLKPLAMLRYVRQIGPMGAVVMT